MYVSGISVMSDQSLREVWVAKLPVNYGSEGRYPTIKGMLSKRPTCRAFRLVDDTRRFLLLKVPPEINNRTLEKALLYMKERGISLGTSDGVGMPKARYSFLGFTEADLKHGNLIFLRDNGERPDRQTLLRQLGSTEGVYGRDGPGGLVARLSLSFAPSTLVISIPRERMVEIRDEIAVDGMSMSRACGAINQRTANAICDTLSISRTTSVFEISIGGIKGVVAAYSDDEFRKRFKVGSDCRFVYRKSMRLHTGGPQVLEVHKVSRPPPSSHLSWAIIAQLLGLGVGYKAFKNLLEQQLISLKAITNDRDEAILYLKNGVTSEDKLLTRELLDMLQAGQRLTEPYLYDRLHRYRNAEYYDLRRKLNIRVQKSCQVFGIIDEIGVLRESEVYINLPHREGVVVSEVLVARRSSYKPGAVRRYRAVDAPELKLLTNCVVFPRKGLGDPMTNIPGSRLDGKMFFVSWDQSILPTQSITIHHASQTKRSDRSLKSNSDALTDLFLDRHHNKLLERMIDEWRFAASAYGKFAYARYPRELALLIEEAKECLDGDRTVYATMYKSYRALRDRYKAVLREGSSGPFRKLQELIPRSIVIPRIKYRPDEDLCLNAAWRTDRRMLLEQAYRALAKFRKDFAAAKRDDVLDKSDYGKGLLRCENASLSWMNQVKQRYVDEYFPPSSEYHKGDNVASFLRASVWYYVGYKYSEPVFAWLGARYLNQLKNSSTISDVRGFL